MRARVEELTTSYNATKEKHSTAQAGLNSKEELLQTLLTGLSSSNTATGGGYMGQLADAKARLAQASAEEEQSRVKLGMSQKDLKTLEKRWKEVEKEAGDGKRNLEAKKKEVEQLRKKVESSGWSKEKETQSEMALRTARSEARQLNEVGRLCEFVDSSDCLSRNAMLFAIGSHLSTLAIRRLRRILIAHP